MARPLVPAVFDTSDLVQLPRVDARSAVSLGAALIAAAREQGELPDPIARALSALEEAHANLTLDVDRVSSAPEGGREDLGRSAAADRGVDAAWSALHDWLLGWSKLPGAAPQALVAQAIYGRLFEGGLSFLELTYRLEWAESQRRLARIHDEKLDGGILELGGEPFLRALGAAHDAYGAALGLQAETGAAGPLVRSRLGEFVDGLRTYVLRVSAHADRADASASALARSLLSPIGAL